MTACPSTLCRGFFNPHNRPCTPKIVGTFYMQGYKAKEKTAILPPVSKLSGHPAWHNRVKLNRDIHFTCILRLLNNTCVKHYFKSVHVSNLFWSREYNSAKEICKYPLFSKVGSNYPLDLKIIWNSVPNPPVPSLLALNIVMSLFCSVLVVTMLLSL